MLQVVIRVARSSVLITVKVEKLMQWIIQARNIHEEMVKFNLRFFRSFLFFSDLFCLNVNRARKIKVNNRSLTAHLISCFILQVARQQNLNFVSIRSQVTSLRTHNREMKLYVSFWVLWQYETQCSWDLLTFYHWDTGYSLTSSIRISTFLTGHLLV